MARISIIGAGWYGCHIALELAKAGHEVTIHEEKSDIFKGLSGEYGIRLHRGPHYPRSDKTRESCHRGFEEFVKAYPELIIENSHSIYALAGTPDSFGNPPKVDPRTFKAVCEETETCRTVNPSDFGLTNLDSAYDLDEPSIAVGDKLREYFKKRLADAGVKVVLDCKVAKVESKDNKSYINNGNEAFDEVVNATGYQSLLAPSNILPNTEVVWQPCLALAYEDKQPTSEKPFSFITMDGSYPCIMPYSESVGKPEGNQKYIVTHGEYTIAGSFTTPEAAQNLLNKLHNDDTFIKSHVKPNTEREMNKFWPEFKDRFKPCGWKGKVVPKLKTEREYRSAVTFKTNLNHNMPSEKADMIHVIPGKVSNIFDAARDVLSFVANKNIIHADNYSYVKGGELDQSAHEITEKPRDRFKNTCDIDTYDQWLRKNLQARAEAKAEDRINNSVLFNNHSSPSTLPLFSKTTANRASSTTSTPYQRASAKL